MPFIEWTEAFSVGIKQIDEQHQQLFSLINVLYDSIKRNAGEKVIGHTLKELRDYVSYHFKAEEAWMKMLHYPDFAKHLQEHVDATKQVNKFIIDYSRGSKTVPLDVLRFMSNWLQNHILQIDRDYIPYLKGKI